jgi:hypothetical protein
MPKSKRRKTRYIPRTAPAQRPAATASQSATGGSPAAVRTYGQPARPITAKASVLKAPPIEEMTEHVNKDLKFIGILTGAMVVAMIVLALVLH